MYFYVLTNTEFIIIILLNIIIILKLLRSLDTTKAYGPGAIPRRIIQECATATSSVFNKLV